jgi:hypothetical protein
MLARGRQNAALALANVNRSLELYRTKREPSTPGILPEMLGAASESRARTMRDNNMIDNDLDWEGELADALDDDLLDEEDGAVEAEAAEVATNDPEDAEADARREAVATADEVLGEYNDESDMPRY